MCIHLSICVCICLFCSFWGKKGGGGNRSWRQQRPPWQLQLESTWSSHTFSRQSGYPSKILAPAYEPNFPPVRPNTHTHMIESCHTYEWDRIHRHSYTHQHFRTRKVRSGRLPTIVEIFTHRKFPPIRPNTHPYVLTNNLGCDR